ncbi:MAG TPA: hypothetical protein VLJ37_11610 [bacterium]|nr:hypothetical protein [bacterium]
MLRDPKMPKKSTLSPSLRSGLLIAGLGLFVLALFSPGIVYRPDVRSNPKHGECAFAVTEGVQCSSFSFGGSGMTSCERVEDATSGKAFVDKGKIIDYCKGWQEPVAQVDYGYKILLMGFLGVFVGVFAWFANPLMLLALALAKFKKRLGASIVSVIAVALGLQSYMLRAVPFNESSMDPKNLNFVDYLGLGFYLWMGSLVVLALFCLLKRNDVNAIGALHHR